MSAERRLSDDSQLTAEEAKCIRVALIFGDPAYGPRPEPDPRLESAKAKLRAIEGSRQSVCPTCGGKRTIVKDGPHELEYDSHYPCPRCTTPMVAIDDMVLCNRCGGATGVSHRVLRANGAFEATCAACAQTMTVDP